MLCDLEAEYIDFQKSGGRKYSLSMVWGQEIFIFGGLGTENIDFLVLRGENILIFGAPEALTKGGDPSTCQNPPESFEKTLVLGVRRRTRHPGRRKSWTP